MEICLLSTHYVTLNYIELTHLGTCTHTQTNKQINKQTNKQTHTHKHMHTHTNKQTNKQTHTNTCTHTHTHTHTLYSLFMCRFVKSSASLYVYTIERKIWVPHINNIHYS